MPPGALCLEIGESAVVADPARAPALLRGLQAAGCHATIEHCGTGMAAFTLLQGLPSITSSSLATWCAASPRPGQPGAGRRLEPGRTHPRSSHHRCRGGRPGVIAALRVIGVGFGARVLRRPAGAIRGRARAARRERVGTTVTYRAPRTRPLRTRSRPSFARSSGSVSTAMRRGMRPARPRNSSPSARVRFATERTIRSSHRIS